MQFDRYSPKDGTLRICTWCGEPLGRNEMPPQSAAVFCSRRCEIEANCWLYQELLVIEITHPPDGHSDRP
jgi:endogenous inhibitor of DNA gyrase (YacG/DUF329 family)